MKVNSRLVSLYLKIFIILLFSYCILPVLIQNISGSNYNLNIRKIDTSIFVSKNINSKETFFNTLIKILHFIY